MPRPGKDRGIELTPENGKRPALLKRRSEQETLQDHQVVGEEAEGSFSVLAGVRAGRQRRTQKAFDHGEDRLDLPALAVGLSGEPPGQRPAVFAGQGVRPAIVTWPAAWDHGEDAANPEFPAAEPVGGLAVVPGVTQERGERLAAVGLTYRGRELAVIGLGSAVHKESQDQVAAGVADGRNLRITGLVMGAVPAAAAGEVVRNVPRLQARRVDGGQTAGRRDQAEAAAFFNRGVKEARGVVFFRSRRWA